jgi:hypothetical protein
MKQFINKYGTHGPKLLVTELIRFLPHGQESPLAEEVKAMMEELTKALEKVA